MTKAAVATIESNPLFRFRAPKKIQKRLGSAHFNTQREDVINDEGMLNIYPGMFTYKDDPTLEIDLALWEDAAHEHSVKSYFKMTTKEGYNVAMFDGWTIADHLSLAWKKDDAGRLAFQLHPQSRMVLMWRTGEMAEKMQQKRLRWSNDVSKSVAEKQAEMQEGFARVGIEATVIAGIRDDDDNDDDVKVTSKSRKRR